MTLLDRVVYGISSHFMERRAEWAMSAALLSTDFIALGILRLLALVINGTFADTWYGRWTHHVRGFLALYSLYVWTTIDSRLLLPIIIIEFSNLALAFGDSGAADRRFKNAAAEH